MKRRCAANALAEGGFPLKNRGTHAGQKPQTKLRIPTGIELIVTDHHSNGFTLAGAGPGGHGCDPVLPAAIGAPIRIEKRLAQDPELIKRTSPGTIALKWGTARAVRGATTCRR